jgi:hypothetical protein
MMQDSVKSKLNAVSVYQMRLVTTDKTIVVQNLPVFINGF